MEGVIVVLVVLVLLLVMLGISSARRQTRKTMLADLARAMGGQATSNSASGTYDGVATRLAFETRGSGSSSESWTYVDCALPPGYPFTLHLEPHGWFDAGKIERGEMVDVVLDDPPFDRLFRIEGAPAAVVRRVLGPPVRGYLVTQGRVELSTKGTSLRLAVRGWLDKPELARAALACAAAIAGGVRDASLALDAEVPVVRAGPAYRAVASDAPLQEARAARAAEVAEVDALRARRLAGQRLVGIVVVIAVISAFAAIVSR